MSLPKVSICIPNYNYEKYISQSVESAINQTYENIEIIVVDNASTDNSVSALDKYLSNDKFTIHVNKSNLGIAENHNIAANYANGEYFCLLSSDDILDPYFIEKTVNMFLKFENSDYDLGLVMTEKNVIDESGNITEFAPFYAADFVCRGESHAKVSMMGNPTPPSFCLIKKSAYLKTNGFQKMYGTAHDWGFMFDINMVSDCGYLHEKLGLYRVHTNESSGSVANFRYICNIHTLKLDMAEIVRNNEYLSQFIGESIEKTANQALKWGMETLKNGNFDAAKKYMGLVVLFDESLAESPVYKAITEALKTDDPIGHITRAEKEELAVKPRTEPYPYPVGAHVL